MSSRSNSRHIAIYVPSLRGGGAERIMVILANGMAARGHQVDLVLTQAVGPYLPEVADNVRIVDMKRGRVLASLLPLARYLRRERPDAMLSALNHANIIAILARKLARSSTRLIVSERNSLTSDSGGTVRKVIRTLMRHFYPAADGVIAVSQAMKEELIKELHLPSEKVVAIPNPIDFTALDPLARKRPDHPWFANGQPPVILAVGRLAPQKDFETLLKAFSLVHSRRSVRLVILGEGPLRPELEQCAEQLGIADKTDLVGFKDNPFGWMSACDLFVLSSRHEGFPNVLVQAMACGARVVSTDCPTGPNEILEGGRWGRLVPVGDADALANAMAAALDDPSPPDVRKRAEDFRSELAVEAYVALLCPPPRDRS
ncbi:glycosyltransferase [Celeribacter sp.]|uniref:glycosyltransferase n=1 Tax=Celeribacter sp. TaxID=1890673 RepID=UPI003A93248C